MTAESEIDMERERLIDHQAIVDVTYRHALAVDRADPLAALESFTDDVIWDATAFGIPLVEGRAAMLDFLQRDAAAMAEQFHVLANHIIRFLGPDSAVGTCYLISEGRTRSGTTMRSAVWNEDTYRRTSPAEWRIASRVIHHLTTPDVAGLAEF